MCASDDDDAVCRRHLGDCRRRRQRWNWDRQAMAARTTQYVHINNNELNYQHSLTGGGCALASNDASVLD